MAKPKSQHRDPTKHTLIDTRSAPSIGSIDSSLSSRRTPEIVIGLVGPIASGVSETGKLIEAEIARRYGYDARKITMSDLIRDNRDLVGVLEEMPTSGADRIRTLQDVGTQLRKRFGSGYLAEKAIEKIAIERAQEGYSDQDLSEPKALRVVHIVDSIKNPAEVEIFRAVYGSAFWLVGVFAPRDLRIRRLTNKVGTEANAVAIVDRDEHEGPNHGQDVREAFYESDYFIRNPHDTQSSLKPSVLRLLRAIFEDEIITPNDDERGMSAAKMSAAASACLSRQVGAIIVTSDGSQIGAGYNEVPRFGGGVYGSQEAGVDGRCHTYKDRNCRNDEEKRRLLNEVVAAVSPFLQGNDSQSSIMAALEKTGIRSLIEFSRSVHAEMAAIVDVARSGRGSVAKSTMYVTTFPCHNCARHIVAAGIVRVVYIEPYPKSLALKLHDDAIMDSSRDRGDATNRVLIEPFEGVGPQRFLSVFSMREDRKAAGGALKQRTATATLPAGAQSLDAFTTLEKRVLDHLRSVEPNREDADDQTA